MIGNKGTNMVYMALRDDKTDWFSCLLHLLYACIPRRNTHFLDVFFFIASLNHKHVCFGIDHKESCILLERKEILNSIFLVEQTFYGLHTAQNW